MWIFIYLKYEDFKVIFQLGELHKTAYEKQSLQRQAYVEEILNYNPKVL